MDIAREGEKFARPILNIARESKNFARQLKSRAKKSKPRAIQARSRAKKENEHAPGLIITQEKKNIAPNPDFARESEKLARLGMEMRGRGRNSRDPV